MTLIASNFGIKLCSIVIILSNLKTDESLIEIFNDEIRINLYIIIKIFKKKKNLKKKSNIILKSFNNIFSQRFKPLLSMKIKA